jgi:AraC-like DNA-binding protein
MKFQLIDIINIIAAFQILVFVFFLLRRKSSRNAGFLEQPNKLLSIFLVIQLFIIFNFECVRFQEYMIAIAPHAFYLGIPFFYLAAPVFYFYVRSLAFSDFRYRTVHFLHVLPFMVVVGIFAQHFYFLSSGAKRILLANGEIFSRTFWIAYNLIFFLQFFVYFLIDLRILKYYREEIKQQFSSVNNINLSWLTFILYGFILAWLSSVASFISRNYLWSMYEQVQLINFLAFFVFFNYIFYKGLSQPEIFSGITEKPKYETSRLTTVEGEQYLSKLEAHMMQNKPYLNPTLTIKELASQISLSPRYLSQIVNEYTRQNFYDFVNRYRIEEAKRMLSEQSTNKNVMEVLYAVGFNSKSSFNTAFKKVTGVTPSYFKKHALTSSPDS